MSIYIWRSQPMLRHIAVKVIDVEMKQENIEKNDKNVEEEIKTGFSGQ